MRIAVSNKRFTMRETHATSNGISVATKHQIKKRASQNVRDMYQQLHCLFMFTQKWAFLLYKKLLPTATTINKPGIPKATA